MLVAGVVTQQEGIFLSVDPFKEKNEHQTPLLNPQRASFMVKPNLINVMVVRNCMNISKYTLTGYISLLNGGWWKKIWIYDDISLNNTILNLETFEV